MQPFLDFLWVLRGIFATGDVEREETVRASEVSVPIGE
jgi:stalled ribosome rescue protein Dom34